MMKAFEGLEPKVALYRFAQVLAIPRPSHKEDAIVEYLRMWGLGRGGKPTIDAKKNISIAFPATPGYENAPSVCLQFHTDMVVGKDIGDELNKPIRVEVVNGWLQTQGMYRTLGADNGAGMVLAMDIIETLKEHGKIFLLGTADEEDDMSGCEGFDPKEHGMEDCEILINLDTPLDATIGIACAGFAYILGKRTPKRDVNPAGKCVRLSVTGLAGGHNGDNVGEKQNRGNALAILGELLDCLPGGSKIVDIGGGSAGNALPADATVLVKLPGNVSWSVEATFNDLTASLCVPDDPKTGKPGPRPSYTMVEESSELGAWSVSDTDWVIATLVDLPNGVREWNDEVPDVPMLSATPALLTSDGNTYTFKQIVRASDDAKRDGLREEVKDVFVCNGWTVSDGHVAGAWNQEPGLPLVALVERAFKENGAKPVTRPFHCLLETGILGPYFKQTTSFGALVLDEHARSERMNLASLLLARNTLATVLRMIAQGS